jgi:prepilin peptidase CpaA
MLTFLIVAVVVSAVAALTDVRSGLIPNVLTLGTLGFALGGHFVHGFALGGPRAAGVEAAFSLGGALLCAVAPGVLYWKNGMGGGDLKLFAALGALCHPMTGLELELTAFALTSLVVPARLAYEGRLFKVLGSSLALALNPLLPASKRRAVPVEAMSWVRLGPAVFAAAVLTLAVHYPAVVFPRFG